LFVSILGALLMYVSQLRRFLAIEFFRDLIYLVVANIPAAHRNAGDSLSLGLIVQGLLGGFSTYNGVVHA
jgi:hypothetical protein